MKGSYSVPEVAEMLGVHRSTVLRWIKAGKVKAYTFPAVHNKIASKDVVKLLKDHGLPLDRIEAVEKKRVLIIDDDENITDVTAYAIKHLLGYNAEAVNDKLHGIGLLKAFKPHLILVDNVMSDKMTEKDFLDMVRNDTDLKRTTVAKYTGADMTSEEAKERGFDGLVLKGAEFEVMVEAIRRIALGLKRIKF